MNAVSAGPIRTTNEDPARARRFRDATLPHLDAVYTVARCLLSNPADAEDAVQECYLRALRYFDTLQGQAAKPWLFAILRNVSRDEYERRSRTLLRDVNAEPDQPEATIPLWREAQDTPETEAFRKLNAEKIRGLLAALPELLREVIVLRDVDNLSYREIAAVVSSPMGTVMSRLARGRARLRDAWLKLELNQENSGIITGVQNDLNKNASSAVGAT
jgi:RNA polymerase sigma-70 factor (ECF subfamily)